MPSHHMLEKIAFSLEAYQYHRGAFYSPLFLTNDRNGLDDAPYLTIYRI